MTQRPVTMAMALLAPLVLALFLPIGDAQEAVAASPSPFSMTFTIQQSQTRNGTQSTVQQAFGNALRIGNAISFFWNWEAEAEMPLLTTCVKQSQAMGLKVVINMTVNEIPGIGAPPGYKASFADPATVAKYVADVTYLAKLNPTYLNIYPEGNILAQYNPAEFANYRRVYPVAYAAAKAAAPATLVGTSYLDLIWVGYHQQALPDLLGPHDFVGITSYPFNFFPAASAIPATWYQQWRAAYPTTRLLFTEIAWGSAPPQSPDSQAAFIAALPTLMQGVSPDVIAYALQYDGLFYNVGDLTPAQWQFYQSLGVDPRVLFNQFNNSGLFTYDGRAKPAWYAAQNLSFGPAH